ncbi:MAG: metallophosphoesterase [Lentimicrobiaceae bacterium]|nr:metallophosphoesterase [Lentimicrobiaceae bacterium]
MKYIGFSVFFVVILAVISAVVYYLSNRFSLFFPSVSCRTWLWSLGCTTGILLIGSLSTFLMHSNIGKIFFVLLAFWITILLYLFMISVLLDLVNIACKLPPNVRGIITLALTVLFIVYGTVNASVIRVKEISIPIAGLTKEIKAVHISDVHLGNFWGEKRLEKIVDKITKLNPDVVFNTGDMFDSKTILYTNPNVLNPLKKLAVPHYFVYGNHDEQAGIEEVVARMQNAGAIVLQNETAQFGELQIIGLNNMIQDEKGFDVHANQSVETIKSVMEKLPADENRPTIVLHHRPAGMEYLNAKKTDLLLAGHTHAGQLFPFILITKAMYHYNKGLYHYNDMNIYVTAGVGTAFMPIRIGANSEITVVKLMPKK